MRFIKNYTAIKKISALIFIAAALPFFSAAQEYSSTQYNIKDGLAGSTVFCAAQDKEGFMWFGTETGLSRFDGTDFKNFTTADGLTDNEVIKIFCDTKGRLWFTLFKKEVCYYFKGKIYSRFNDSLLSHLHLTGIAWQICEDSHGNVLVMEDRKLHKISAANIITEITTINNEPIRYLNGVNQSLNGDFWVINSDSLYELNSKNKFSFIRAIDLPNFYVRRDIKMSKTYIFWRNNVYSADWASLQSNKNIKYSYELSTISFNILEDSILVNNTTDGAFIYNLETGEKLAKVLTGKAVNSCFIDNENNFWLTTQGNGIYRISSFEFKNIFFYGADKQKTGIFSLMQHEQNIVAGSYKSYFFTWPLNKPEAISNKTPSAILEFEQPNRIVAMEQLSNGDFIAGSDAVLYYFSKNLVLLKFMSWITTKGFFKINDDSLLIADNMNLLLFDCKKFKVKDTIWKEKTTTAFYLNGNYYAGTLDGLLILDKNKTPYYPGTKYPVLKNKITNIKSSPDGTVWLATYGGGIAAYKNGKLVANLTTNDGLTSNICRCLCMDGNYLWAGTDKGLNKIDISNTPYKITKFTSADGLASDIINTILINNNIVYAATPEGITYFNENSVSLNSVCDLRLKQIITEKDTLPGSTTNFILPHTNNSLKFEYVAISYKSAGDITYYYRHSGPDTSWQTTTATSVNYTTLPSGSYSFQLRAVNKFGAASNTITIYFSVEQLLWEKTWFRVLAAILLLLMISALVKWRVWATKKRSDEKLLTMQQMAGLEQKALRSQMNPHFIFNSLNSIQQYVMDKDVAGANKFISDFSKLIRATLDFSSKEQVSIAEEIEYLSTYLDLERGRQVHTFFYNIITEENTDINDLFIPPLILQPYLENSIRHGIRYRNDSDGNITVHIKKQSSNLTITIEDNGIGRKASASFKSANSIQYQSKGMALTANRIEILNKQYTQNIKVIVEDKEENQTATGTKVTIVFPLHGHK